MPRTGWWRWLGNQWTILFGISNSAERSIETYAYRLVKLTTMDQLPSAMNKETLDTHISELSTSMYPLMKFGIDDCPLVYLCRYYTFLRREKWYHREEEQIKCIIYPKRMPSAVQAKKLYLAHHWAVQVPRVTKRPVEICQGPAQNDATANRWTTGNKIIYL